MSDSAIDPAYDVSNPVEVTSPVAPVVNVKKKKRVEQPAKSPTGLFWQVATFFCLVAIVLIAIGIKQGRFAVNQSLLEAIGITGPAPTDPPQDADPKPVENQPSAEVVPPSPPHDGFATCPSREPCCRDPSRARRFQPLPASTRNGQRNESELRRPMSRLTLGGQLLMKLS
jgi:hypothetical protein